MTELDFLETKVQEQVPRKNTLEELLKKLKQKDRLFDYNVPETIIKLYNDHQLLDHLKIVYAQPEFIVDDPRVVRDNSSNNDIVIKKGYVETKKTVLTKNTNGTIKRECDNLYAIFNGIKFLISEGEIKEGERKIAKNDIQIYSKKRAIGSKKYNPPINAMEYKEKLTEKSSIKYIGPEKKERDQYVDNGTKGIIVFNNYNTKNNRGTHGDKLFITWIAGQEKKFSTHNYLQNKNGDFKYYPKLFFKPEDIKLVVKNNIDFDKLYEQVLNKQQQ
ncbi:hypothetical protein HOK51_05695 [Candidatus Woesearchaeota archaeon]|jgi:hypothetical protein|nr:hypothetical protein [Candidatus Woesearchaeota archaeon]